MTILILILLTLILLMLIANFYALHSLDWGFPHFGKRDEMNEFIRQGFVNTKGELLHCFGVLCNKIDYEGTKLRQELRQEIAELEERLLPKITPTLVSVWPVTDEKFPLKKTLRKKIMDYLLKNKGKEVHYTKMHYTKMLPCYKSSILFSPSRVCFNHDAKDKNKFSHNGYQSDFRGFTFLNKALIETS